MIHLNHHIQHDTHSAVDVHAVGMVQTYSQASHAQMQACANWCISNAPVTLSSLMLASIRGTCFGRAMLARNPAWSGCMSTNNTVISDTHGALASKI